MFVFAEMTSVIPTERSQGDRKQNGRQWRETEDALKKEVVFYSCASFCTSV